MKLRNLTITTMIGLTLLATGCQSNTENIEITDTKPDTKIEEPKQEEVNLLDKYEVELNILYDFNTFGAQAIEMRDELGINTVIEFYNGVNLVGQGTKEVDDNLALLMDKMKEVINEKNMNLQLDKIAEITNIANDTIKIIDPNYEFIYYATVGNIADSGNVNNQTEELDLNIVCQEVQNDILQWLPEGTRLDYVVPNQGHNGIFIQVINENIGYEDLGNVVIIEDEWTIYKAGMAKICTEYKNRYNLQNVRVEVKERAGRMTMFQTTNGGNFVDHIHDNYMR